MRTGIHKRTERCQTEFLPSSSNQSRANLTDDDSLPFVDIIVREERKEGNLEQAGEELHASLGGGERTALGG